MKTIPFLFRMLRRDARAGELRLLVLALVIAVAALSSVGFFSDRIRQALEREANQLMGADMLLSSTHPWPATLNDEAKALGLFVAQTQTFPSMVTQGEGESLRAQLAEIKSVSAGYPLRGKLRIASVLHGEDSPAEGIPARGTSWVDERLAQALSVKVGDNIAVGQLRMSIAAILTFEPDRGVNFFSVAPRVLINETDLEATGLIQPGSRVSYRLLFSGETSTINKFKEKLTPTLKANERIEDTENARPEIRRALERAQKFLGLCALLTVILAAVAVALASRRYMQRHLDPCAVMRCLGATANVLIKVYVGQFAFLGLISAILGCLIGYVAHFALYAWLSEVLERTLPSPGWMPALQACAVGFILLFGFALPPLMQLKSVSTLRVLRREFSEGILPQRRLMQGYLLGFLMLGGLMFWIAGEIRLGAYVFGAFSVAMVLFALIARLFVWLVAKFRGSARSRDQSGGIGWRYGLASLERRWISSVVQIVALSIGFMALLLLTATRNDLLSAWQRALPADAPNRFVINIQPDQLEAVRMTFQKAHLDAEFSPMVRARLTQVNGVEARTRRYADEHAQHMVEREFNLSYRSTLPPGNTITAGRWFDPAQMNENTQGFASMEEGLAKRLDLKTGDKLEFTVAGESLSLSILSLRKLNWDSMRVNFFVLTPPKILETYPASWITSFYLPKEQSGFVDRLIGEYPNLTVIDVAAIVRQLQAIIDQVAQAVQFVFLFTLLAGIIVLYAALISAAEERRYELAIMRALGASREQLRRALLAEFAAIGGLAGLIAGLAALGVSEILAGLVFQFEVATNLPLPILSLMGGAALVTTAGWFAATRLIETPPLEALRSGG